MKAAAYPRGRLPFSKRRLQDHPAPLSGRVYLYDTEQPGLCLSITANGSRAYFVYRKVHGRPIRYRLGGFDDLTVEQARKSAQRVIGQIAEGKDPQAERQATRHEQTLQGLFDYWRSIRSKKKSWAEDERQFGKYLGHLKNRRLSSLSQSELRELHASIGEKHGPYMANRVLSLLRSMLNRADQIGYQGINPALRVEAFPETKRDRFVREDEMPRLFKALAAEPPIFADFFTLALLTGARRANLQSMTWADVHLGEQVWRVPDTKSGDPVNLHLPAEAVKILGRRKAGANGSRHVFPANSRSGHIMDPKTAWKRITAAAGLEGVRIHDLRRSLGSWMANSGASLPIVGKALGHKTAAATAIYARLSQAPVAAAVDQATSAMLAASEVKPETPKRSGEKAKGVGVDG